MEYVSREDFFKVIGKPDYAADDKKKSQTNAESKVIPVEEFLNENKNKGDREMIKLYKYAIREYLKQEPTGAEWPECYKNICERVRAVTDWTDPTNASDELINEMIYESNNGVSHAGQAYCRWDADVRPPVSEYREMLQQLKDGLQTRFPADRVRECREIFMRITGNKGVASIFNRIVSAFQPGVISPVMFENYFDDACAKLVAGGYIQPVRERIGDDPWYAKNVQLMKQLKTLLPDGSCEGAIWAIDDYTRGMFVWAVHTIDMGNWMILRNHV